MTLKRTVVTLTICVGANELRLGGQQILFPSFYGSTRCSIQGTVIISQKKTARETTDTCLLLRPLGSHR